MMFFILKIIKITFRLKISPTVEVRTRTVPVK